MDEIARLEEAIDALEARRGVLGDAVVDLAQAPLLARRDALRGPSSPAEQRKQITALLADIAGFTARAAGLDAEELRELVDALWRRLDAVVADGGGVVGRHMGDALLALWGAQSAREDDPERAVRTALALQAEIDAFAGEMHGAAGLRMRVGVHTGPAWLGRLGTTGEFSVVGDAVDVAEVLQQAAPPGGVLISHRTYRLVQERCDAVPQRPVAPGAGPEPIAGYLVRGLRPRGARAGLHEVAGVETRLIGRDAEMHALETAARAALEDSVTRLVIVTGDAGVGKSRLLFEFERRLAAWPDPPQRLRGQAAPESITTPYSVLHDLFRQQCEILDSDRQATVRTKFETRLGPFLDTGRIPLVAHLAGFDLSGEPGIGAVLNNPSFAAMAVADLLAYFRNLTSAGPTVVLLDELHWADNSSLDFIARLAGELPDRRLLIVGQTRPALYERRPGWGEGARHMRLDLKPLSAGESGALIDHLLQKAEPLPGGLRQVITDSAGGNPYYLVELVRMLIAEGIVVPDQERWHVATERLTALHVPPTLVGVLQAQLDGLPTGERELLQYAAVVGRRFWDALLAALAAGGALDVDGGLGALRARGLIVENERSAFAGAREYLFQHALLRDAAYETVLLKRRRQYHAQVARWLEARGGERLREHAGLIAEHYEHAGEPAQAVVWLHRAGEQALQARAFPEGCAALERALALLPADEQVMRTALLVRLGEAANLQGNYRQAIERLQAGLALARARGDIPTAARALCWLSTATQLQGAYADAFRLAEEALACARQAGDRVASALALYNLGASAFEQSDFSAAVAHSTAALELYREIGDAWGVAQCLTTLMGEAISRGDYPTAVRYVGECLNIERAAGDRMGTAQSLANLGWILMLSGDHQSGARYTAEALTLARELGIRSYVAYDMANLGYAAAGMNDAVAAARHYRAALREALDIGLMPIALEALAGLAGLQARAGDYARAAEWLAVVLAHPAVGHEIASEAGALLEGVRGALPAAEVDAALARGRELRFEAVVATVLQQGEVPDVAA